jgi:alanyl-tRNA synthetase
MGLERLAMVCQGVTTTYDTDLLRPIMDFVSEEAGLDSPSERELVAVRVVADHARALCFAISEGVLPSNEGRGYVIRRILRRAVVRGLELGIEESFLYKAVGRVVDVMRSPYPDIADNSEQIALIVKADEERFQRTLSRGMAMLRETLNDLAAKGDKVIAGDTVFKLYDTYGFPVEITQELAANEGFEIDSAGFDKEMECQREKARQAAKTGEGAGPADHQDRAPENFVGYEALEIPTVIAGINVEAGGVEEIREGQTGEIRLERTPFYPEGGGQVGDVGSIQGAEGHASVKDVKWLGGSRISHLVEMKKGRLGFGDGVVAKVDSDSRRATQRNHTATHLLQAALRSVLGGHVRQSGSLVAPERLRFDFTHYEPMTEGDIHAVEDIVNRKILDNLPVRWSVQRYEDAKARGAIALFGDKYGQDVRVVDVADASCELCGGTHVESTGEIGAFHIVSESGIAAGVRRIEAITGDAVIGLLRGESERIKEIAAVLRVPVRDVETGARKTVEHMKHLEDELQQIREKLAGSEVETILAGVQRVNDVDVVSALVKAPSMDHLKHLVDRIKERLPGGVVCLGSAVDDRAMIVVGVDPVAAESKGIKASVIAKKLGQMVGGKGGGKDTFAQAGGKDIQNLASALERSVEVIASLGG